MLSIIDDEVYQNGLLLYNMAAQTRFLNCSIALEVVFAILMMVGFAMSIARSRQKKYKD